MNISNLFATSLLTLSVALAAAPLASAADARVVEQPSLSAPAGASRGSATDQQRYAAKAAKSGEARQYRGGEPIVITTSVLVVVLLVILIIVLI